MKTQRNVIEPLESRIAPAVFTVTTLADSGNGSLRAEILLANAHNSSGDTIIFDHIVGGKTVPLTGTIKLLSALPQITDGVTIIGSVPGSPKGITIDGNKHAIFSVGNTSGAAGLNDLTITNGRGKLGAGVYITDTFATVTITDCVITGNQAVGSAISAAYGGGIYILDGTVTIQNSKIAGNSALGWTGEGQSIGGGDAAGGGIDCVNGTLSVINSTVSGNHAIGGSALPGTARAGGGAYGGGVNGGEYAQIMVQGSVISDNTAIGGNGGSGRVGSKGTAGAAGANGTTGGIGESGGGGGEVIGGGIHNEGGGSIVISNSTISGNFIQGGNGAVGGAGGKGGAGGSGAGEPHAGAGGSGGAGGEGGEGGESWGGGVEAYAGGGASAVTIQSSTISGNTAVAGKSAAGGGGGAAGAGSYKVGGVSHHGSAGAKGATGDVEISHGGAMWAGYYSGGSMNVTLSQVTVAQNSAQSGGGLYLYQASATINNCTIAGNVASLGGGGLFNQNSTISVASTIIATNKANSDPDVHGAITDSHDLIGLVTSDTVLLDLGATDVNGTATVAVNPLLGPLGIHDGGTTPTMLLSFLSPAIGQGSNPDSLTVDQNGDFRSTGGATDIGAVQEGGLSVFAVTTLADSGAGSLRAEIALANSHAAAGDTIVFEHLVHGKMVPLTGTIKLLSDLPEIIDGVTIIGPTPGSAGGITIDGNKHAIFEFNSPVADAGIKDLTITNGESQDGGGVFIRDSGNYTISIEGCIITGNHVVGNQPGRTNAGGGIDTIASYVEISNTSIIHNTVIGAAGNATFAGSEVTGGGIDCDSGSLTISNSIISGNTITGGSSAAGTGYNGGDANGGGVDAISATVVIHHSVISGNTVIGGIGGSGTAGGTGVDGAAGGNGGTGGKGSGGGRGGRVYGGGVNSYIGDSLTITGSTISGNTLIEGNGGMGGAGGKGGAGGSGVGQSHAGAGGDGGVGGSGGSTGTANGAGVHSYYNVATTTLSIQASTISGNKIVLGKASAGGAGGAAGAGSYKLAGVVHRGSTGAKGGAGEVGAAQGGGVWAGGQGSGETLTLSQVTISQNSAQRGGGIYLYDSDATIDNCTISLNTASVFGGGLASNSGSTIGVISTIIAGNTALSDADVHATITDSNDLIGLVTAGTTLLNGGATDVNGTATVAVNPLLGPLGYHEGGTTETMLLSFLSPAIGAGSNPDTLTTDPNGAPRETGGITDIGAVEEG